MARDWEIELTLIESATVELDIGWVFFWDSTAHLAGDEGSALGGGGPILIDRRDGSDHMVWSGESWETAVERYRNEGDIRPRWLTGDRHLLFQAPESWPADFFSLAGGDRIPERVVRGFDEELRREIGRGHRLRGRRAVAIAKRDGSDEVLFVLPDSKEVVVVHLTWSGRREQAPWPTSTFFRTFAAFLDEASDRFEP